MDSRCGQGSTGIERNESQTCLAYGGVPLKWTPAPRLSGGPYSCPDVIAMLLRVMWCGSATRPIGHHSWAESLSYMRAAACGPR